MRIAILHSRIRVEERLLADELSARNIEHELIDIRTLTFDIHEARNWSRFDAVIDRCIGQTQALAAVRILERFGVLCVNTTSVIEACGDKLTTSLLLAQHNVPTPRTKVALDDVSALAAIEEMGYPCVLKPATGSWGRLLARVNDRDSAEAIVEHKSTLGSVQHSVFYIQEYIRKPERDLRVFVVGEESICGIVRNSSHWITNTARGGQASNLVITPEIAALCRDAARAITGTGEGAHANALLAIDLLECPERGLLVSEINHTMEFRNSIAPTGVNIPGRMIDWVITQARARGTSTPSPVQVVVRPAPAPPISASHDFDHLSAAGAA